MYSFAVLLTSHNRIEHTALCLEKLYECELPVEFKMSVFLVDDGSIDGTAIMVKNRFSSVNLIKGSGDLYWNRGMLLSWISAEQYGNFDFFIWLNDDTYLFNNALINIFEDSRKNHHQALICSLLCDPQTQSSTTYGGQVLINNQKCILLNPTGYNQNCDLINGNFVLIPDYVYRKVGKLDPFYIHAIGDFDYGLRAKALGIKVVVSSNYLGTCAKNEKLPLWCVPGTPLFKRVKSLYSPLGNSQPIKYGFYTLRHFGLLKTIRNFLSIHLRLLFPKLWLR